MLPRVSPGLFSLDRGRLTFHFDTFETSTDQARITMRYSLRGGEAREDFVERIELPGERLADPVAFERIVRLLWLAAGLSYYKAFAPPRVEVSGGLTPLERDFLAALFRGGLGEFAYVNDLPGALTPEIVADSRDGYDGRGPLRDADIVSALVPVGGGKDSIDTIETLRGSVDALTLFSVNDYAPINATAQHAALPLVKARRVLEPRLFELNDEGALNGHVPVTAVNSVVAVLTALRVGADAVVFSNERSASSGNLTWHGHDINHQWSKSLEFERLLRSALHDADCQVDYFSLLRPLSELAIVRRFAGLVDYHRVFTSCNRAFRLSRRPGQPDEWCGDCDKCRFVYLMLAAFLPPQELVGIFGHDLFGDPAQAEGFAELLGLTRHKPFECVGEEDECRVAWALVRQAPGWSAHPFVVDEFGGRARSFTDEAAAAMLEPSEEHCLPKKLEELVRATH